MIKINKQWIRSFITILIGTVLYTVLKIWKYPAQSFIDEVYWAFAFGVIAVTITENSPCFISFSLWNRPLYFERYSSTVICNATPNVTRLDLPSENRDISNATFRIMLPCFSGVDAQYIPVLCENNYEKKVFNVSFRFVHLTLYSPDGKKISQQYPIKPKPLVPYIGPLGVGEKIFLIFQINLSRNVITELQNGRILLGISVKVNRQLFRQYYLLELQVFAGKCALLTQSMHSSLFGFYVDQWTKSRQIETVIEEKHMKSS